MFAGQEKTISTYSSRKQTMEALVRWGWTVKDIKWTASRIELENVDEADHAADKFVRNMAIKFIYLEISLNFVSIFPRVGVISDDIFECVPIFSMKSNVK